MICWNSVLLFKGFLMKIKNLKYTFGLICLSFFACWVSFWDCTEANYWVEMGKFPDSSHCRSNATSWPSWYDNQQPLPSQANLFLKMIGKEWIPCDSNNVAVIQRAMKMYDCATCIDWKAWEHMRSAITQCDLTLFCVAPAKLPTLDSNNELVCEDEGYTLQDNKCCVGSSTPPQISYTPQTPTLTDNTQWNRQDNKASLTLKFNDDSTKVSGWNVWSNSIATTVWTIWNINENRISMEITFDVNVWDSDSFTINYVPWIIIFTWNVQSLWWSKTFNRNTSTNCPNPSQGRPCAELYWWIYYEDDNGCCIRWDACLWPDENNHCPEWYAPDSDGCCSPASFSCGENEVSIWWECTWCVEWTIPNENKTKCICDSSKKCCWIQLNTVVPFIWDCIEMGTDSGRWDTTSVTSVTAFPILMQWLMKILMSVIMVFSFIMVIVSWLMMTAWAFKSSSFDKWKTILKNVLISLILLWCSWLILSLINPSFFGG